MSRHLFLFVVAGWLCLKTLNAQTQTSNSSGLCPESHLPGPNGSCYWFNHGADAEEWWDYGRSYCLEAESDLAIINDQEELNYILSQTEILAPGQDWWIGYFDVAVEGWWRWMDCSDTSDWQSTLWAPGEPAKLEDCAFIRGNSGQIAAEVCDKKLNYICEVSPKGFTKNDTYPRNVAAVALSSSSVEVSWEVSQYACEIFGYRVHYYTTLDEEQKGSLTIYGGNVSSVILTGLNVETEYSIGVAGLNLDEELDQVGPVLVTTPWGCPPYYEEGPTARSCYAFVNEAWPWDDARSICASADDGDLAIINDDAELQYVMTRTAEINPGQTWWLGYFDASVEGWWRWVDCGDTSDWQSTLWAPGEPAKLEDCAFIRGNDSQIAAEVCNTKLHFICEVSPKGFMKNDTYPRNVMAVALSSSSVEVSWEVSQYACEIFGYRVHYYAALDEEQKSSLTVYGGNVSSLILTELDVETEYSIGVAGLNLEEELDQVGPVLVTTPWGCPPYYEEGPTARSCYAFVNEAWPWDDARSICASADDGDLAIINDDAELQYVMTRTAEVNPGQTWWLGYFDASVEGWWRWVDCSDTSDWQSTLWAPGEPAKLEDCAFIRGNDSQIAAEVCNTKLHFICEVSPKGFMKNDTFPRNVMAVALSSSSVEVLWEVPQYACEIFGYRVHYYAALDEQQKGSLTVYGGNVSSLILTGLDVETEYSIGVAGLNLEEELDQVGPVLVTTPWGCPPDYEEGPTERSCYAFYNETWPWDDARSICASADDGDLAIINDDAELQYVMTRTAEVNPGQTWWLGYSDVSVEGVWQWVDCKPTTDWQDLFWPTDQSRVSPEDCGYLTEEGSSTKIRPAICNEKKYILCEVTKKGFQAKDSNVRNVRASSQAPDRFEVMWDVSPTNCEVFGYDVFHSQEATPSDEKMVTVYGGDSRDVLIRVPTVTQDTVYLVSVVGLTALWRLDRVGPARVTVSPESNNRQYRNVTEDIGTITSPGYPAGYENNLDITWTITVTKPGRVQLTITSLNLDAPGDYLAIGSGTEASRNELDQYTGILSDVGTVESESNQMWLRLITDATNVASGFSVSFTRLEGDETSDCSRIFTDLATGTFSSPNYPDPYPNNARCVWKIKLRDVTSRVQLNFNAFDLETGQDFVIVGSGSTPSENTLQWLTGSLQDPLVMSPTNKMWLRFMSDKTVARPGFMATFTSVTGLPLPTPVYETADSIVFIVLNQNTGWFTAINKVLLANAIADLLSNTTSQQQIRQQRAYNADDIKFLRSYNVGADLHIIIWVHSVTATDPITPLDPKTVLAALASQSEFFQRKMSSTFEYRVELPVTTTPTDASGLSDWAIALIAVGALLFLVLIGLVMFGCGRKKSERRYSGSRSVDDIPTKPKKFKRFRPTSFASDGTWNQAFQVAVEDDGASKPTEVTVL